jgi:hypothetical protein
MSDTDLCPDLEGVDRERPGDILTILIGYPAMLAAIFAALYNAETLIWKWVVLLCAGFMIARFGNLLAQDKARIDRNIERLHREIRRRTEQNGDG